MNEALLRKVKAHILAEPKRLFMKHYIVIKSPTDRHVPCRTETPSLVWFRDFPECGTVACIAGWGALLTGANSPFECDYAVLFKLNSYQASRLFNPRMWPEQFKRGTWDDGTPEAARAAADRIDFFIETRGTDRMGAEAEALIKAEAELGAALGLVNEHHWRALSDNFFRTVALRATDALASIPEAVDTNASRETVLQEV